MIYPCEKLSGIILAGGKSRRMGTEKGLIKFHNKALIEYAIDALKPLCNEILISSNTDSFNYPGFRVVKDDIKDIGPMAGIYSCLKRSNSEHNFLLSCDMPFITPAIVRAILNDSKGMVSVPWHGGLHYEPMCGYYNKVFYPILRAFSGKEITNYQIFSRKRIILLLK